MAVKSERVDLVNKVNWINAAQILHVRHFNAYSFITEFFLPENV